MEYPILTRNDALDTVYHAKEGMEGDFCENLQKLIASRPFGKHKFYIFTFMKRVCDITGTKKLYMYARLTKPEPLPGTSLMRADPNYPEEVKMIWSLPNEDAFGLYRIGKMFSDPFVHDCIMKYMENPRLLMGPEEGDLSDEQIREVYRQRVQG